MLSCVVHIVRQRSMLILCQAPVCTAESVSLRQSKVVLLRHCSDLSVFVGGVCHAFTPVCCSQLTHLFNIGCFGPDNLVFGQLPHLARVRGVFL